MNKVLYQFGNEFTGTKEQSVQWLGDFNLDDASQKIFLLDPELRSDFRQYMIKRSQEHLRTR